MTTSAEFIQGGITGQTFREIKEKFGDNFNDLVKAEDVMGSYALAFAWFRDHEHLGVPEAYGKAMSMSSNAVKALFEHDNEPAEKAAADFASQPPTTTP